MLDQVGERLRDVVHAEREVVHLLALAVREIESAPPRVPVQLEGLRGPRALEVGPLPAVGHRPLADHPHPPPLARLGEDLQGLPEAPHPDPRVVEPEPHGGCERSRTIKPYTRHLAGPWCRRPPSPIAKP